MQIELIAVGKVKEKYLTAGIEEYGKRLKPYAKWTIREVADEKAPESLSEAEMNQVKEKEGGRLLSLIRPDAHVIALDRLGEMWSSEQLSSHIAEQMTYGCSQIAFVIGGSLGLSDAVLKRANARLSFGNMTYPHQLMRLIVIEQVYRAFKIMRGEPYHK